MDTREQTPWAMAPCQVQAATLATGDYSVLGLEHNYGVCLERKSLPDLISCVGAQRDRFTAELKRLMAFRSRAVIVEATWDDLYAGGWRGAIVPAQAVGSVTSWIAQGIPIIMAGNRAAEIARDILFMAARREWSRLYTMHKVMTDG